MYMNKTLKEMLENPLISEISKDAISKWDLSEEEFYNWTLQEIADKMGWRNLERGFERLYKAADSGNYYFRLYDPSECEGNPQKENTNIVYFPSDDAAADDRPFILLVPGGGFINVWNLTEGWPVARIYNELGYHVVILTYQICVPGSAVKAMDDIARAFEIISAHKDEFHVDPERYITCGFSAGGYVVCLWNTDKGYASFGIKKPCACFPVYPVTSYRIIKAAEWDDDINKEDVTMDSVGCSLEEACNSSFEIPEHVLGFPPTAIFVAAQDDLVDPDHSRKLAEALTDKRIPCLLEVGPTGGHGFADGVGMCMEGWPNRAIAWYEGGR